MPKHTHKKQKSTTHNTKTKTHKQPTATQDLSSSVNNDGDLTKWALRHPHSFVRALKQSGVTKQFKRFRARLTPKAMWGKRSGRSGRSEHSGEHSGHSKGSKRTNT